MRWIPAWVISLACILAISAGCGRKESAHATPAPEPARDPVVVLETTQGTITLQLDPARAPQTTENFLRYVRAGHYDGTVFHRVIPDFMIQGGGMTPDMREKRTNPPIRNESGNGLRNHRGTIAMARTLDPHSATAQFFINLKDNAFLDAQPGRPGYAVFGKVIDGMGTVDTVARLRTGTRGPHENVPVELPVIRRAYVQGER